MLIYISKVVISIRFNQIMEYFKIGWIAQYQNKGDRFEIILYRHMVYGKMDSCYDRVYLNYISKVHIGVHSYSLGALALRAPYAMSRPNSCCCGSYFHFSWSLLMLCIYSILAMPVPYYCFSVTLRSLPLLS